MFFLVGTARQEMHIWGIAWGVEGSPPSPFNSQLCSLSPLVGFCLWFPCSDLIWSPEWGTCSLEVLVFSWILNVLLTFEGDAEIWSDLSSATFWPCEFGQASYWTSLWWFLHGFLLVFWRPPFPPHTHSTWLFLWGKTTSFQQRNVGVYQAG